MKIIIKKYNITVCCSVYDVRDYDYVMKRFDKYIIKDDSNDTHSFDVEIKDDEKVWELFNNVQTCSYKMFHCCPAEYLVYESKYYIKCTTEFTNYVLCGDLFNGNIVIYRKNDNGYDNRRYIFNVICEIISVASYFDGYMKLHAALFSFKNKGFLILGEKKSGKTTLLMDIVFNGGVLINNDITRVIYNKENDQLLGFEWIERVNIGRETILDNGNLLNILEHTKILVDENFNNRTCKYEFYKQDVDAFCNGKDSVIISGIVIPHFDKTVNECHIEIHRREIFSPKMLSLLNNTWLPIVSDMEIRYQDLLYEMIDFKCELDIVEIWYGPNSTKPANALLNTLKKGE